MKYISSKVDRVTEYIEEQVDQGQAAGVSVCLVQGSSILYSRGFGLSQITPVPRKMTPDTIMSIQSVSKNFMALSVLQLAQKRNLNLDAPLSRYLDYFTTANKEQSDQITIRQILSHTAGFPHDLGIANMIAPNVKEIFSDTPNEFQEALEYYRLTEKELKEIKSREDVTRWFKKVELEANPGEKWNYCTDAYVLLADLFEKVSGQNWEKHLTDNILMKIGMNRTTTDPTYAESDDNSSRYYMGPGKIETPFPINPISAPIGFLYSTANDLGRYLAFHLTGTPSILSHHGIKEMQKPIGKVSADWYPKGWEYGLAWFIGTYKNETVIEHGGGQLAVRSLISMVPRRELGIVVLMNSDSGLHKTINRKIMDIMFEDE
ncbi:CubicO group peptidase (beta-lactamase class C family) [Peribacillus deserti]|uniref:CubicO group peptidase (Beta-lactamase class C family) n=1 Tax=Peribacillus deserti TaxID=673318 RepID=A0ABS2QN03_9BACI|nr:serine hydrolase domain-containing protein [Peribacillus deserti]MBM7694410.1 CubicO group peptidase (beta-lactamase class C family) [Peribacillus deserti]